MPNRGGRTSWDSQLPANGVIHVKEMHLEEASMPMRQRPFKPSFILFMREYSGTTEESWMPFWQSEKRCIKKLLFFVETSTFAVRFARGGICFTKFQLFA
jgi:hypothetical protein